MSDDQAASAAEHEVTGQDHQVDWPEADTTFTLPASVDDWDLDAMEAMEKGQSITMLACLIGPQRWDQAKAQFRLRNGRAPKLRDVEALAENIAKVYGFESVGESGAS